MIPPRRRPARRRQRGARHGRSRPSGLAPSSSSWIFRAVDVRDWSPRGHDVTKPLDLRSHTPTRGKNALMAFSPRVLANRPVPDLAQYEKERGGQGLQAAVRLGVGGVIDELAASGLRGRGGAGFPTGRKWATVADNLSPVEPATVVVNAAEGEPGSFKDRAIVRADPYRVVEGALIAAFTVGADHVIIAVKETFSRRSGAPPSGDRRGARRGLGHRCDAQRVRRPSGVPVRRGDRAAGGDRRSRTVPPRLAAVPARRRGVRARSGTLGGPGGDGGAG